MFSIPFAAAPYFVSAYDSPCDVNVTDGEDVVINCNSYASPEASVSWFLNGEPFNSKSMVFRNVCFLHQTSGNSLNSDVQNLYLYLCCHDKLLSQ